MAIDESARVEEGGRLWVRRGTTVIGLALAMELVFAAWFAWGAGGETLVARIEGAIAFAMEPWPVENSLFLMEGVLGGDGSAGIEAWGCMVWMGAMVGGGWVGFLFLGRGGVRRDGRGWRWVAWGFAGVPLVMLVLWLPVWRWVPGGMIGPWGALLTRVGGIEAGGFVVTVLWGAWAGRLCRRYGVRGVSGWRVIGVYVLGRGVGRGGAYPIDGVVAAIRLAAWGLFVWTNGALWWGARDGAR